MPFSARILLLSVLLLSSIQAKAGYWGGEFGWEQLGGDTFKIDLTVYHDCKNTMPSYQPCTVDNGTSSAWNNLRGGTSIDITPICKSYTGGCSGSSNPNVSFGISRLTYSGIFVLDNRYCNYTISWSACCRSKDVSTLYVYSNTGIYVEAKLNRCGKNPNTISFDELPPVTTCNDQYQSVQHTVSDKNLHDGDSAVYSLGKPLSAQGSAIPYKAGYSYQHPAQFWSDFDDPYWGFHPDSATGMINFRPAKTDIAPYVIVANIYRYDTSGKRYLAAQISREAIFNIVECGSKYPPEVRFSGSIASNVRYVVAERDNQLRVITTDKDKDTVSASYNIDIPGVVVTPVNAKPFPSLILDWKPKREQVREKPYIFSVSADDSACPYPGRTTTVFSLYVLDSVKMQIVGPSFLCNPTFPARFFVQTNFPKGEFMYKWDFGNGKGSTTYVPGAQILYGKPGKYTVKVEAYQNSQLWGTAEFAIEVGGVLSDFQPTSGTVVNNTTVGFTNKSQTAFGRPLTYYWDFGDGNYSVEKDPVHKYRHYGSFEVKLTVKDTVSGCASTKSQSVNLIFKGKAGFTVEKPYLCLDNDGLVCKNTCAAGDSIEYLWLTGDGATIKDFNLYHTYKSTGKYIVRCIAQPNTPMADTAVESIEVGPPITVTLVGPRQVKVYDTVEYTVLTSNYKSIIWDVSSCGAVIDGQGSNKVKVAWKSTWNCSIRPTITTSTGCVRETEFLLSVAPGDKTGINRDGTVVPSVSVFPNPAPGIFHLSLSGIQSLTRLKVVNSMGQMVSRQDMFLYPGQTSYDLDLQDLKPGIYFLYVESAGQHQVVKLVRE